MPRRIDKLVKNKGLWINYLKKNQHQIFLNFDYLNLWYITLIGPPHI